MGAAKEVSEDASDKAVLPDGLTVIHKNTIVKGIVLHNYYCEKN